MNTIFLGKCNGIKEIAREIEQQTPHDGEIHLGITFYLRGAAIPVFQLVQPVLDTLRGKIFEQDSQVRSLDVYVWEHYTAADPGIGINIERID